MPADVRFPGGATVRASGAEGRSAACAWPEWGVYADMCWEGWPGEVLDWPDYGLPTNSDHAVRVILQGLAAARQGKRILVGCLGGNGRTGAILAVMAAASGVAPSDAVAWVRRHYRDSAVETTAQAAWVCDIAASNEVADAAAKHRERCTDGYRDRLVAGSRQAIDLADGLPQIVWAVPGRLGVVQRPLRWHPTWHGRGRAYPPEAAPAVGAWVSRLVEVGVKTIVSLTTDRELGYYVTAVPGGLLERYRDAGIAVVAHPTLDPADGGNGPFMASLENLAAAVGDELSSLPWPAVISCSSGIDRSPPVAARIAWRLEIEA